jgi:hypothetical protein
MATAPLEKSEEQLAPATRFPPVEAGGEFIQVVVQVLQVHRFLVRAHQPALEGGDHLDVLAASIPTGVSFLPSRNVTS